MPERYKILVTGSRNHKNYNLIKYWILWAVPEDYLPEDVDIIHGDCWKLNRQQEVVGADGLAAQVAAEFGMLERAFPADWDTLGAKAGPIRNNQMLDLEPNVVLGFPMKSSKGTWQCVQEAVNRGIETYVFTEGT